MTAFITNAPTQAESMLRCQEQASRSIGLYVNENKTECMSFNRDGVVSTLNDGPLKLVEISCISAAASRQLKGMSQYAKRRRGQLSIRYPSYVNLIYPIK